MNVAQKKSLFMFLQDFLLLCIAVLLIFGGHHKYGPYLQSKRDLIAPPKGIEHITFGNQEVVADMLWIRAIQDFDYCGEEVSAKVCKGNGWLYRMLDAITELSPNFKVVYETGGLALTVLVNDFQGASRFFDKSVLRYPDNWIILYRASYHYLYEEKNKEKAAEHLRRAAQNGGPSWLYNLAGRLYTDTGYKDLAKSILQEMIETNQNEQLIKRLKDKIAE